MASPPFARSAIATHGLLTVEQMGHADRTAIDAGTSGTELMEAAGAAVARETIRRWQPRPTLVLAGPGNNGGDGFVAARHLARAGWPVRVALLGDRASLTGDAAWAAGGWNGLAEPLVPEALDAAQLVIDAVFGAGLARPVEGAPAETLERVRAEELPMVAVDMPSGVHGDSGAVLGVAAPAALTVTFFRRKPGHLLLPGRMLCGETVVADIGIPATVLDLIAPDHVANAPELWRDALPQPTLEGHKYTRGHVLVLGGTRMTGAGRLASRAALRAGAGMVTVACAPEVAGLYQAETAAVLTVDTPPPEGLGALVAERRVSAIVAGPGLGHGDAGRALVEACLATGRPVLLDADALTAFTGAADELAERIAGPAVLTPHDGEFARLFPTHGDKRERARRAADATSAVVVLKGADTVIAAPAGAPLAINETAPPWLATAGAGDVLSGIIGALIGGGMPPFPAACAGVWIHGAAAKRFGPGLIADDLPEEMPDVVSTLHGRGKGARGR